MAAAVSLRRPSPLRDGHSFSLEHQYSLDKTLWRRFSRPHAIFDI